jgi:rubrerythrin
MNLQENISRIKEMMGINEERQEPTHALIEILPSLAYMDEKYRYQVVPHHATKKDKIYIKKGSAGNKSISTKNIKVIKSGSEEEMKNHLSKLKDKEDSSSKWIKCVNCNKKFTQTIHKGKKSLPICPHCGTNNDIISESEISPYFKRRLFNDLPNFIRSEYQWLAPWSFNDYDEYMSRIIFNVVREISNSSGDATYEETLKIREKIEPMITEYIVDNFSDEIYDYYLDNQTPG